VGRRSARALASSWPDSGSVGLCGRRHEGLQLMRQSLGHINRDHILAPFQVKATEHIAEEDLQAFASKLRPQFEVEVDESRAFFFKSVTAPSWVHVLQTPDFWLQTLAGNLAWDSVKAVIRVAGGVRQERSGASYPDSRQPGPGATVFPGTVG
jgi:hypothetical protein